jgi:ubiquinone/menaquinone biosynthesis C-methylase UbiE
MTGPSHQSLVSDQFGPRAGAYLASAVHAEGEDLAQMQAIARGRTGARLLDMGCGAGHVAFRVAPEVGAVVALDLSADMLRAVAEEAARRGLGNITTECGTVERLPFPDASFDIVMSRYSAHHWHGFAAGLREARRVLKPEGTAVFVDVVSPGPALLDTHLQTV